MADKRMFSKSIISSDAFTDLPISAQALYFHLGLMADDDGFLNNTKMIIKMTGTSKDDLEILEDNNFIIVFESGVVAITHWKIHNYVRKDTYRETVCNKEKALLFLDKNGAYTLSRQRPVDESLTQYSIDKDSIDKDSIDKISIDKISTDECTFIPPSEDEIKQYCVNRNNNVDAEKFFAYYQANGWMIGKNKMKNWKAAVRTWEKNNKDSPPTKKTISSTKFSNFTQPPTDFDTLRKKKRQALADKVKEFSLQEQENCQA